MKPLIIAHRGGAYGEEENSLAAYKKSLKMGVDGIEMDLRMTKDRMVVCHHDRGVWELRGVGEAREKKRYWIDKISWEELRKIKKGVVRFEEVVKKLSKNDRTIERYNDIKKNKISLYRNIEISNIIFDLDLKQEGMEREIVKILRQYKIRKVMVNSTDVRVLKSFEDYYPSATLALIYAPKDRGDWVNHQAIRFLTILAYYSLKPLLFRLIRRKTAIGDIQAASLNYRLVNTKVVQFLHQYNIKVFVWGTDEKKYLQRMIALGVDGVKTKRPDLLRKILEIE